LRNSGVVTEQAAQLEDTRFLKYVGGETALVAQGGGQRGIFTSGVIDAFLYANFDPFNAFYGTSAGAMNLCAYLCRQAGLGRSFLIDLTTQPEFFSLFGYIRHKQPLGLNWALNKIRQYPYKLDIDMGRRVLADREALASVTDSVHLQDKYYPFLGEDWFKVLMATCAIPRLYDGEVDINGVGYVDGGISASIPIQEAWRRDARLIVVIRTENINVPVPSDIAPEKAIHSEGNSVPIWLQDSVNVLQRQWDRRVSRWKDDWAGFLKEQFDKSTPHKDFPNLANSLNGGRWLFGAGDVYRLSHILGERFDSGLADMLMVHYQTYSLTQDFIHNTPEDCFIVQIAPEAPLKSGPLLSSKDDLLSDYLVGLRAGQRFIESYAQAERFVRLHAS